MTTGEIIKQLINAENYTQVRIGISDVFINYVRVMLPSDYDYFAEKEQAYQDLMKRFKDDVLLAVRASHKLK